MPHSFGQDVPPFALGVEEELFLVDAETLEAAPIFEQVVPEADARLKPELFACMVETTTPVRRDADEVLDDLARLRAELVERASRVRSTAVAVGTHPFARGEEQPLVPLPRYERLRAELGELLHTQLVCGLHVHVALPDAETALRAFEGVVPWLPVLLALSANSPYAEGEATGLRSTRAERLLLMPTGGTPPPLPDWSAWEEATAGDDTRRHWDAWPRPDHGTLEVRVMDQQTDVRRSAGFAAIVQALIEAVVDDMPEPYDRELYATRRAEAARLPPDPDEVAALRELIPRHELVDHVLTRPPEAERQLELGPEAALRELASQA
jgi:glutamate---cysteine ligase / carboxylate-amine ligase